MKPIVAVGCALGCVVLISVGQLLFKQTARLSVDAGTILAPKPLFLLLISLGLYGFSTVAWIYLLRSAELSHLYPVMALSFLLVPLSARYFFGEQLPPLYWPGIVLLLTGILMTVWSRQ